MVFSQLILALIVLSTGWAEKNIDSYATGRRVRLPRTLYTPTWAVEISGGEKLANVIASRNGFLNFGKIDEFSDIYRFELGRWERMHVSRFSPYTAKSRSLAKERGVGFFEQQAIKPRTSKSYQVPRDPLFSSQWQLLNSGQLGSRYAGKDMKVEQAWLQGFTGCNVSVGIVDDGLDITHDDLWDNYAPNITYDFIENDYDPSNVNPSHGTACGGIVGASQDDRTCGVGIAHQVNLGGLALLGANSDMVEADALSYKRDIIDVYSNSWGPFDSGSNVDGPGYVTRRAFKNGVRQGRQGKGSIYVWANGNGGEDDDCGADGYASSIYTISVGAIGVDGHPSSFDEPCSAKMVVAYVTNDGGISSVRTTSLDGGCNSGFGGTSAATPLVSSIIALTLEANPSLTWRDVQYLIVYTANSELTVGSQTRNGAGLAVSRNYGFGVMDAEAMVSRARHWINVPPQMNDSFSPQSTSGSGTHSSPFVRNVQYSGNIRYIEHVTVTMTLEVDSSNGARGDMVVQLSSPSQTQSTLLGSRRYDDFSDNGYIGWTFMSVMFWGEDPHGQWTLTVKSISSSTRIRVRNVELKAYGVSSVPEAVRDIPERCHADCDRGCAGNTSNHCDSCTQLRNSYTLECITQCPPGYTERNGYCFNASLPVEECNSPMKTKEEATCIGSGFETCCTGSNCEARNDRFPRTCFCDNLCYKYQDCCSDIQEIGCTEPTDADVCGILPYIEMGSTRGVTTTTVPYLDDGTSDPIDFAFPIGRRVKSQVYVGTNGYFTFEVFSGYRPFTFGDRNQSIVAPLFTDLDVTEGDGIIQYEVHTQQSSPGILSDVNKLISNCSVGEQFVGNRLLVATWKEVPYYGQSNNQLNTFQGILITDSANSYAVFTYYCGDLSGGNTVSVGFGTEDNFHATHPASHRGGPEALACLNTPATPWVNVVYRLNNNVNECLNNNGGCPYACKDTAESYICVCPEGYSGDGRTTCTDIDECATSRHDCEHNMCNNTIGSYTCSCNEGYALNSDNRTCSISCGGIYTAVNGSFHTPDYPVRYPFENFRCEWVIDIENANNSVIEISFNEPYGINGRHPCQTDYVEVFDGIGATATSFGRKCFLGAPSPVLTTTDRATVVFQGSRNPRSSSRVGVSVNYIIRAKVNECEIDNGGCEQNCTDTIASFTCSCHSGYRLGSDQLTCIDIDECSTTRHNCEHMCTNTIGSYTCSCNEGYGLNSDNRTCSISCGGIYTAVNGSFHTPDYPARYPFENFRCEWVIDIENANNSIIEISFNEPYGINGKHPCQTDYVEVFDGIGGSATSFGRKCFLGAPSPVLTTTDRAKIVFQGSRNPRSSSRVGVSMKYTAIKKVNECEIDNGGCQHECIDTLHSYTCSCHTGYTSDPQDKHNCIDIDECSTSHHGCRHFCVNTEGSYVCACREGYGLNPDGTICSISCGGIYTAVNGSFHTPDYPVRYPFENFRCEWVIDIEDANNSVIEISFNEPYGINGKDPCPTDYVEVFDGIGATATSFGRKCFLRAPSPVSTTTTRATVVFQGSPNFRSSSRVGVSVSYELKEIVNECNRNNGGCEHSCEDTINSYVCSCNRGYAIERDGMKCKDIDECTTQSNDCEQECINTQGSFTCACRDGYKLDTDGRTCVLDCDKMMVDYVGSFQTPGWPNRYPQANFRCEWTFDMPTNVSIQFTADSSTYGINGRPPCVNDHIEFFDGLEDDSTSMGKYCKFDLPPPMTTSTGKAKVVFVGKLNSQRPPSRKGVRITYNVIE